MIVVATEDFELYHALVSELRGRDASFTTIEPGDELPDRTAVVITGTEDEAALVVSGDDDTGPNRDDESDGAVDVVVADADDPREAIERTLVGERRGRRIVGVDPGTRPGVAVLDGEDIVAAFQVPLADAPSVIRREVEDAVDPVVRIGDGARLRGSRLIDALDDVRVELVDETGSTPHLGSGARGMGDVLAAVNIARREGEPIERREIEPTPGEIESIKSASRERSAENRAIPAKLARRVAKGDLTVEEALDEHREE